MTAKDKQYDHRRRELTSELRRYGQLAFRHETNADLLARLRKLRARN